MEKELLDEAESKLSNWAWAVGRSAGSGMGRLMMMNRSGLSLVQGSLWLIWAKSDIIIPISGFRNVDQVTENCGA